MNRLRNPAGLAHGNTGVPACGSGGSNGDSDLAKAHPFGHELRVLPIKKHGPVRGTAPVDLRFPLARNYSGLEPCASDDNAQTTPSSTLHALGRSRG